MRKRVITTRAGACICARAGACICAGAILQAIGLCACLKVKVTLPEPQSVLKMLCPRRRSGAALKKVGTSARKKMEMFFDQKVFLTTRVKVRANWRQDKRSLEEFGYID